MQLEISVESNHQRLEAAKEKKRMLQDRISKLEEEKRPRYEELSNVVSHVLYVGSFGMDQMAAMEEETVQAKKQT